MTRIKTDDSRISREEMVELFGEEMPIEAVNLLWGSDGSKTCGELRAELRRIAKERVPRIKTEDVVGRLIEKLRQRAIGKPRGEYGRGWNCGLEEAEDVVRAALSATRLSASRFGHG